LPPEILLLFFGSLFGIGGIILAGQRMQYRHKERLQEGADPEAVKQLTDAVRDLQEDMRRLQDSSADFDARLEFTERLLSKPKTDGPITG
jgi:hypothetical protein